MRVRINGFVACSSTALAAVAATAAVAAAQPPPVDGIVRVAAAGEDGDAARLGFVADDQQHVVAGIETLRPDLFAGKDYTVRTAAGDEYPARGVAYDETTALALLKVEGSLPPWYPFARDPVEAERRIYGVTRIDGRLSMRAGSVSGIEAPSDAASAAPRSIRHNVPVGRSGYGSPLFNNCGEVSGAMVGRAGQLVEEPNAALAVSAAWLERVFGPHGLAVLRTGAACVADAVQAAAARNLIVETEELDPAAAAPEEVEPRREAEADRPPPAADPQTTPSSPAVRIDPPAAEARAGSSTPAAEPRTDSSASGVEARTDSSAAAGEPESDPPGGSGDRAGGAGRQNDERNAQVIEEPVGEAEQDSDATVSPAYWVSAVVAGIALPALIALMWLARRSGVRETPRAPAAAAQPAAEAAVEKTVAPSWHGPGAPGDVPDVLFTGADRDGRQVALRVPGVKISESAGAIVGRNPFDGAVVLNHEEVSRRHFRLFVGDGGLMIEDLGSMNGTQVGGVALPPGSGRALRDGERLTVGSLSFATKFVPARS